MKQFSEYPVRHRIILLLSSGLLTGYIPLASGTFATILAVALFYPLSWINQPRLPAGAFLVLALLGVSALAVGLSDLAEGIYGEKDSHKIVLDEIAGFFVAMTFVPFRWPNVIAAFVLFRFFDVLKPAPIRRLQALPGGWGVVADDLVAGLYTCLIVHGLRMVTPWL